MKTLCIVPCGSKKIWDKNPDAGPTVASEVYIGGFAKKCGEYAKVFYPLSWCILSAKYGFILPDEVIPEPYNVSFNDKSTNPISSSELSAQAIRKGLNNYDKIAVLGGKHYIRRAKEVFPDKEIVMPLDKSGGIGCMMRKLNELMKKRN
jgi:hypothetical protein